jgi:hypothetical protein
LTKGKFTRINFGIRKKDFQIPGTKLEGFLQLLEETVLNFELHREEFGGEEMLRVAG